MTKEELEVLMDQTIDMVVEMIVRFDMSYDELIKSLREGMARQEGNKETRTELISSMDRIISRDAVDSIRARHGLEQRP